MGALQTGLIVALAWAALALAAQVWRARGGGRREFSRPAGRPMAGLLYNFTLAMLPGHKEAARLHPAEFVAGVLLHVGVLAALGEVLLLATGNTWPPVLPVLAGIGLAAAVVLLVRRVRSALLRALSTPDDYLAIVGTCGLLALAVFPTLASGAALLAYAALLLVYLPLGKLRHAVFFFVARADYGWRLGYRGVIPPAHARGS